MIELHTKTQGEIRAVLLERDGKTVVYDSGWFPNLILNEGLVNMGETNGWASNFNVGTSSQQVMHGDTQLYGWLADAIASPVVSTLGSGPNWEWSTTKKARFNAGVATGTLREVGMNPDTIIDNTDMSIRALLSPEIVKASDQVLDLYYKLTRWPDVVDRVGTTFIDGIEYNYIVRGCNYGQGNTATGSGFIDTYKDLGIHKSTGTCVIKTGEIAAINSEPTGQLNGGTNDAFPEGNPILINNGSGFADFEITWGLDRGNGTWRCITLRESGNIPRGWQIRFGKVSDDSGVTKDNTKEMVMNFRTTWDRL